MRVLKILRVLSTPSALRGVSLLVIDAARGGVGVIVLSFFGEFGYELHLVLNLPLPYELGCFELNRSGLGSVAAISAHSALERSAACLEK